MTKLRIHQRHLFRYPFRLKPCCDDFPETARFGWLIELVVPLPPDQVFRIVTELEEDRVWFPNFKTGRWLSGPGPGAVREYRTNVITILEHFTIWEPGQRLRFWASRSSLPLLRRFMEDYRFEGSSARTTLTWRVCYEPSGLFAPARKLLAPVFGADFREAAWRLGAYCEHLASGKSRSTFNAAQREEHHVHFTFIVNPRSASHPGSFT